MNCKLIARQDLHEKYALGQLAGGQLAAYEAHLRSCPACQSESQQELTLIAGLKDFGQAKMKDEIQEQVAAFEIRGSGWTWDTAMKLAAAAVFLIMTPTLYFIFRTSASHEMAVTRLPEHPAQDLVSPVRKEAPPEDEAHSASIKSETQAEGVRFRDRKKARQGGSRKQELAKVGAPIPAETKAVEAPEPIGDLPLDFSDKDSPDASLEADALAETDNPELPPPDQGAEDQMLLQTYFLESRNLQSKPDLAEEAQTERLEAARKQSGPRRQARGIAPTLIGGGEFYMYQRPPPAPEGFAASSTGASQQWRFVSKEKVIVVNFPSDGETRPGLAKLDEKGFEVHLVELDSTRIVMNWDVSAQVLTDLRGRMTIEMLDKRLVVRVAEGRKYEISLLKPDSRAVRIKPY